MFLSEGELLTFPHYNEGCCVERYRFIYEASCIKELRECIS